MLDTSLSHSLVYKLDKFEGSKSSHTFLTNFLVKKCKFSSEQILSNLNPQKYLKSYYIVVTILLYSVLTNSADVKVLIARMIIFLYKIL